jgi:hypothetical protein
MIGGFGSTWGDNFYMGTQNRSNNDIWHEIFLYLTISYGPLKFTRLYHPFAMFSTHALREGWGYARAHKRDDLYPLFSKLEYVEPACIVWLYNTA